MSQITITFMTAPDAGKLAELAAALTPLYQAHTAALGLKPADVGNKFASFSTGFTTGIQPQIEATQKFVLSPLRVWGNSLTVKDNTLLEFFNSADVQSELAKLGGSISVQGGGYRRHRKSHRKAHHKGSRSAHRKSRRGNRKSRRQH
jgi:hypothetical protein